MNLELLGLSKKEKKIFLALQKEINTPLLLARQTKISRTGVYAILQNLKKRGLIGSTITSSKKHWALLSARKIEEAFYATKRSILRITEGKEEVFSLADSAIFIHRGKKAIRNLLGSLLAENKNERLYGFQGDLATKNWNNTLAVEETNQFNRLVKKHGIIVEAILPSGWLERQTKELGAEWARDFEGRTTRTVTIDDEYFKHGGQLFIFKNSIYLMALGEEIIIEIRHSEIQKMLLALFQFAQKTARLIDPNELLRKLTKQKEK